MGSCLEIISDHTLEFKTGQETLNEVSRKLNVSISDGGYKTLNEYPKTDKIEEIEYFIPIEHLDNNFTRWNEVKILSNYLHCPEFSICKNTIIFNCGVRYKYWRDVVMEELNEPNWKSQYEFVRIRWINLIKYIPKIVKAIGGNNLIFYEDDRFQDSRDLCYQGKNLTEVSSAMESKWESTEFKEIVKLKDIHKVRHGWYYQTIEDDI